MIEQTFSRIIGSLCAATVALSPMAAQAQQAEQAAQPGVATLDNPFGLPSSVTLLGKNDPNVRKATAVVNGSVITGTDVDQRMALLLATSAGELTAEQQQQVRLQVLRNLIDEALQIQAANALEMPVSDDEVNQRYAAVAARNFGSAADAVAKMDKSLADMGSSPASLKQQIRGELAWNNVLRREVIPFINVSEEEAKEVLAKMEQDRGADEYRIAEIYLAATPETRNAVFQNAQQITEQIKQGGNFQAYARQFSDSSTAAVGGDLGFVRLATLPAEMATEARQMQPGQLVGPFEIPGGFLIMLLIDKRKVGMADPRNATLSLKQISITVPQGATDQQIGARLQSFSDAVQSMRGCGDAETVAARVGASVVTNDELKASSLPPQLQNVLLQLQVGESTPPFGSPEDGFRVLMLCGRDDPQSAALPSLDDVVNSIEEDRIGKRAQRYLRDLRNDAFIEYN